MYVALQFLFFAHRLVMLYIYTKFRENVLNIFRDMERTRFVTDRRTTMGKTIHVSLSEGVHIITSLCVAKMLMNGRQ